MYIFDKFPPESEAKPLNNSVRISNKINKLNKTQLILEMTELGK